VAIATAAHKTATIGIGMEHALSLRVHSMHSMHSMHSHSECSRFFDTIQSNTSVASTLYPSLSGWHGSQLCPVWQNNLQLEGILGTGIDVVGFDQVHQPASELGITPPHFLRRISVGLFGLDVLLLNVIAAQLASAEHAAVAALQVMFLDSMTSPTARNPWAPV
jgi:hypothetical protein